MQLNAAQRQTIARDYTGEIVSSREALGEYSDESSETGFAAWITLSTGYRVKVGRYGAVLAEIPPETPERVAHYGTSLTGRATAPADRLELARAVRSGAVSGDTGREHGPSIDPAWIGAAWIVPTEHGPELPSELPAPISARLDTTFRGAPILVHGLERSAHSGAPMVRYTFPAHEHTSPLERAVPSVFTAPLRAVTFPRRSPGRVVIVPGPYVDSPAGRLELETPDAGETGHLVLTAAGAIIAAGGTFRAPEYGASLLEQSSASLAGMFGAFLSHALESSEPDAREGWAEIRDDSAGAWADALATFDHEQE